MESTRRQQHVITPCPAAASATLCRVRTLGELRLEGEAAGLRGLRRKERLLLVYLARATGPTRRAELTALLWGAQPESRARHSLRQALCALRKALPGALCVAGEAICLLRGAIELDVAALEREVREGEVARAVARWDGEFLAGLEDAGDEPFRAWIEAERAAVRRLLSGALDALATSPDTVELESAVEPVRRWADAHPWDEMAHRRLVRLLTALGRTVEAEAWRARAAERLAETLGVPAVQARGWLTATVGPTDTPAGVAGSAAHAVSPAGAPGSHLDAPGAPPTAHVNAIEPVAAASARAPAVVPADGSRSAADAAAAASLVPAWLRVRTGGSERVVLAMTGPAWRRDLCDALCRAVCATDGDDGVAAAVVLRGMAHPSSDIPSRGAEAVVNAAWSVARRLLAPIRSARGLSAASDAALADVAELVPALRSRYPDLPAAAGCEERLRQALQEVLCEIAAEAPLLLIVEEAPSADIETRRWLASLATASVPGVMVVLTGDAAAFARDPALSGMAGHARLAGGTEPGRQPGGWLRRVVQWNGWFRRPAPASRTRPLTAAAAAALLLAVLATTTWRPGAAWSGRPAEAAGDVEPAARALYDAGLHALYGERDDPAALRFFSAALRSDSTFALAAYYAGLASGVVGEQRETVQLLDRAEALSEQASERDRLYILAGSALILNDPAAADYASDLARQYPSDVGAGLLLASSLAQEGRFADAARQLRRVIGMSPPAAADRTGDCHRCRAYAQLAETFWMADSVDAALHAARAWAALSPAEPAPQVRLAGYLLHAGRYDEAVLARRRAADLGAADPEDVLFDAVQAIRSADFAAADPGLEYLGRAPTSDVARRAVWLQVISFRNQQRHADALAAATRYRQLLQPGRPATHPLATPQAVVLMESGQAARAAAMFDTMYHRLVEVGRESRTARDRAWLLTLRASALAAAGDTTDLAVLADSIMALGLRSGYGRDRRLHHHVRGMLLRARGDGAGAERELRRAIYSPTTGYTRTNVELARTLIEQARPAEALPPLRAALRAPVDGPALYVTRTELYGLLARAFADAGVTDSAAAYEHLVASSTAPRGGPARDGRPPRLVASRR